MAIKLNQMKLMNFKGIKELSIDFNGQDTNIYGKNATGKTSVVDAFTWVFFDKDSEGNKNGSKNFNVKTHTKDGEFLHNLEHSVEITLLIDGEEKKFKKIYKEKYIKQRGATTATFSGHENLFYIDDVPKKKKEFDEVVNGLFDSTIFQSITDPFYFNKKIDWKERKRMLIEMYGDITDNAVIAQNSDLKPLENLIQSKSIDDLRAQLKSQMKPINDELKAIPIKINEAHLAIPTGIKEFDKSKYNFISKKINELEAKKQMILNGGAAAEKETELIKLKNQKLLLKNEVPDIKTLKDEEYALNIQKDSLQRKIERAENDIQAKKSRLKSNELMRDDLRKKYFEVNAMQYDESQNICPHCKQILPANKIERFMEEFNISKSDQLENINSEGMRLKEQYECFSKEIEALEEDIQKYQALISEYQLKLKDIDKKIENINEDFAKEQEPKINAIDEQIIKTERQIEFLKSNIYIEISKIDGEMKVLKEEKNILDAAVITADLAETQKKRIEELGAKEKQLSNEYTNKEKLVYLCELFIKEKTRMLLKNINSHFELNKYVFFIENNNGGIEETCIATNDGVYYSDVNNAKKFNMGLEVINAICKYKGIEMPVFIDNSEGVNEFIHTDSQQIRFYVTDHDDKLRIENE